MFNLRRSFPTRECRVCGYLERSLARSLSAVYGVPRSGCRIAAVPAAACASPRSSAVLSSGLASPPGASHGNEPGSASYWLLMSLAGQVAAGESHAGLKR